MTTTKKYKAQKQFWENAGKIGYGKAVFANPIVEEYIVSKQWETAIEVANTLELSKNSSVLELGCGDGQFAEEVLSKYYNHIDAFDVSSAAIQRAQSQSKSNRINYSAEDLSTYDFAPDQRWEGAFLIGFLHHVKQFTPSIVSRLSRSCPKVIVLEPNGNNLIRKSLELLPSYRQAGEDSFRLKQLIDIFKSNGYRPITVRRINLIPQFLPKAIFPLLKKIDAFVEPKPIVNRLCSTYVIGFEK